MLLLTNSKMCIEFILRLGYRAAEIYDFWNVMSQNGLAYIFRCRFRELGGQLPLISRAANPSTKSLSVMPATTAETLSLVSRTVSVAPLVLLSAADHFGRSGKGKKRVVGVLLGQNDGKNVRVSNSFASEYYPFTLRLDIPTLMNVASSSF